MQWYNEPASWQFQNSVLTVTAGAKTDFWRKTLHNFITDNGNYYYQEVTGNFTAQVKVSGQYGALYDQAGLMARFDEITWLKCGIEYMEGVQHASAVVTRDFSDWSVVVLPQNPASTWFRLVRTGSTFEVYYSLDDESYTLIRQASLTDAPKIQVGLMVASPTGEGFTAVFEHYKIDHSQAEED